mmetsp:Transcript_147220/g.472875  ORF Transcript_147220/g.472875 Transcript_147220/m.472875 type:complete len:299 (+) Transcript_147220:61-957(+)
MELLASLRTKASAGYAGATGHLKEHIVGVKQRASKLAERITTRIAGAFEAAQSAKLAALEYAAATHRLALKLKADVQSKGVKVCAQDLSVFASQFARETVASTKLQAGETIEAARAKALANIELTRQRAGEAKECTVVKAKELYTATGELVSQKSFQTTAASAGAGAVALGAGGAATGLAAGGVAGAAAGLPLALFTFGLSIPAGAILGSGAGLVLGAAAGATAGFVGGGAAGFGVYTKKDDIRGAASGAFTKASQGAECMKGRAIKSVEYAKGVVVAARARLVHAGTGGTAQREHMD